MKRLKDIWKKDSLLLHSYYDKDNDILCVVVKSATTGKKTIHNISEPLVPVYIINKDIPLKHYRDHAHLDEVTTYWVPEKYRVFSIAQILGIPNFADRVKNGSMSINDVYLHKRVVGSDKPITDLVMRSYVEEFTEQSAEGYPVINPPEYDNFHLGALDIETDVKVCPGDIHDMDARRKQPINVITYIDNQSWVIRTIALRNKEYKGQREIENDMNLFEADLKHLIRENIKNIFSDDPSISKKTRDEVFNIINPVVDKLKLDLTFTNSERSLIKDINKYIFDEVNPDYLYIYNAEYDIHQQKLRCEELNVPFEKLFKYKELKECIDFRYEQRGEYKTPNKRIQTYCLNNPTKIIDQMLLYYQLRSSRTFAKYSLDATANREIGTAKLNWSNIVSAFEDLVYEDYRSFLMYNIIDVLIMLLLDKVTFDTFTAVYKRFNMVTEWERLGKPMARTTNTMDYFSYKQNYITANEINPLLERSTPEMKNKLLKTNPGLSRVIQMLEKAFSNSKIKDKTKRDPSAVVPGGLVSSPNKISSKIKNTSLFGSLAVKNYNKQGMSADNDATSMYPNNNVVNNASKATLYGVIQKIDNIEENNISQKLAMGVINDNKSTLGHYLYNLPTAEDLLSKYKNVNKVAFNKYKSSFKINKDDITYTIPKEYKTEANAFYKLWNKCYNTSYNYMDMQTGAPENNLFVFSDDTTIEISYYGTKVIVTTPEPTTRWFGIEGVGVICGQLAVNKGEISNKYMTYIESLIPNEDPAFGLPEAEGVLDASVLFNLSKAKYTPLNVEFNDHVMSFLNRSIFANFTSEINWSIYPIIDDKPNRCKLLRLMATYPLTKDKNIQIEQRIIFYDMKKG